MCRLSWNLGASTSWNPQGLSRPVMGLPYLYIYIYIYIYICIYIYVHHLLLCRFKLFRMWRSVIRYVDSNVSEESRTLIFGIKQFKAPKIPALPSFETSRETQPATRRHIPQGLNFRIFHSEDGGRRFIQGFGNRVPDYMASRPDISVHCLEDVTPQKSGKVRIVSQIWRVL